VTLDYKVDRTDYARLVDVALRRIPTASRGNWTLHAPVDPGITLIELFAWLLDQRSYRADQVTAPLVRAVMRLFGEQIRSARPAGVAVTFESTTHGTVPRRTTLRVPETDLVFTLLHGITVLALERHPAPAPGQLGRPMLALDAVAGYGAEDLRAGRAIPLLRADGRPGEARIGIALAAPPPRDGRVSILFELDTEVRPEWDPEAAAARPPAVLRWEYRSTGGAWRPLPGLNDGTLGLRCSGLVRFAVPGDWGVVADKVRWLRVVTDRATFSSPPVVRRIEPNSAIAQHLEWHDARLAPRWLPLPGRTIELSPERPVLRPPGPLPLPERTMILLEEIGGRRRWHVVPDLALAGPGERVAVVDRERSSIVFGDGLTGRLPRLADKEPQIRVIYALGGGTAGNIPPCEWEVHDSTGLRGFEGADLRVRSFVAAVGGRAPETLDEARGRAAADLKRPTRAATPLDHETIACTTPGVAVDRAHAEVGFVRGECGVVPGVTTVFVVPGISSRTRDAVRDGTAVPAPAADPGLIDEVRAALACARLVGESIRVESAVYRTVRVRATVASATRDRDGLRRRLASALRLFLDPRHGGEDGTGWPFGAPVRSSALLGVAQREIGDLGTVTKLEVAVAGECLAAHRDIELRPYELVAAGEIEIRIETAPAAEVGLR